MKNREALNFFVFHYKLSCLFTMFIIIVYYYSYVYYKLSQTTIND